MKPQLLDQYRHRLLKLQGRLIQDVNRTEDELREDIHKPGTISNVPTHNADADTESLEVQVSLAQNEQNILEHVAAALERIENGTYGQCENCGREISASRLEAVPYAALCIECARQQEIDASAGQRRPGQ